jgi:hypothetical protein
MIEGIATVVWIANAAPTDGRSVLKNGFRKLVK